MTWGLATFLPFTYVPLVDFKSRTMIFPSLTTIRVCFFEMFPLGRQMSFSSTRPMVISSRSKSSRWVEPPFSVRITLNDMFGGPLESTRLQSYQHGAKEHRGHRERQGERGAGESKLDLARERRKQEHRGEKKGVGTIQREPSAEHQRRDPECPDADGGERAPFGPAPAQLLGGEQENEDGGKKRLQSSDEALLVAIPWIHQRLEPRAQGIEKIPAVCVLG